MDNYTATALTVQACWPVLLSKNMGALVSILVSFLKHCAVDSQVKTSKKKKYPQICKDKDNPSTHHQPLSP